MFYFFSETIPPNTSKKNYKRRWIDTEEPCLEAVYIQIPPGVCGLAGFRVRAREFNIFPRPEWEFFTGDNVALIFNINYFFEHPKTRVFIDFYNEDDTYPHTIFVGLLFGSGVGAARITPFAWGVW